MSRYVAAPLFDDPNLSQDAALIARDVSAPIERWINDSVDALQREFQAKISAATQEIQAEAAAVSTDLERATGDIGKLVEELDKLNLNLPPGVNAAMLQNSKKIAGDLQNYLKQREDKWRNAGVIVAKAISGAKTAFTGVP